MRNTTAVPSAEAAQVSRPVILHRLSSRRTRRAAITARIERTWHGTRGTTGRATYGVLCQWSGTRWHYSMPCRCELLSGDARWGHVHGGIMAHGGQQRMFIFPCVAFRHGGEGPHAQRKADVPKTFSPVRFLFTSVRFLGCERREPCVHVK